MHRPLPCRLSENQIAEKARLAAGLEQECTRLDEERKQKDREFEWRTDFRRNLKELIRMDTGAIVETAALTAEERQGELFLVDGESAEQAG